MGQSGRKEEWLVYSFFFFLHFFFSDFKFKEQPTTELFCCTKWLFMQVDVLK
jgi:hypothetical protein